MTKNQSDIYISSQVYEKVLLAMKELLEAPIPPYARLRLDICVHDGYVRAINTIRMVKRRVSETAQKKQAEV